MEITNISQIGLDLIKQSEGLRLKPYLCPADKPTIGYGSTTYENGVKVTLKDPQITKERAEELLKNTLHTYEACVRSSVNKPLTQNQFDALVSFTYNLGCTAFKTSTLLKKINVNPNDASIGAEFDKWINSNGKPEQGLITRRKAEYKLYSTK